MDGMTNLLLNTLIWGVLLFLVFVIPSNPPQTEVVFSFLDFPSVRHQFSRGFTMKTHWLQAMKSLFFLFICICSTLEVLTPLKHMTTK